MKNRFINILILFAAVTLCISCDDDTDDVSFITTYPDFEIQGGTYLSIVSGNSYEDAGAIATEGENQLEVTSSGSVDSDTPGLYTITYTATNSDGYDGSAQRVIAVTEEDVSSEDLSGPYLSGSRSVNYEQRASGLYYGENLWADSNGVSGYFLHTEGSTILVPQQDSPFGAYTGSGTINGDGTISLRFEIIEGGNAGAVLSRTLTKQ
ncbi:immunoglobulin-like domain-containing protein [Fulvivirga sediminis]|uniref:DUF5011 domain-containing protein n=1 Tax=Fulvivirga sediminis TaxID=2803949 RepID=A0A937F9Q1_9BACT|nr:immunoglobulin-like domain-containing protein [Fulvivirga sediminis]MBL3656869.1 DUF5011 domain-containing protein [Fulvivirga sediminis]